MIVLSCMICTKRATLLVEEREQQLRGKRGEGAGVRRGLVLGQVALDLPFAYAADVLLPFLTLGFDEPLVDVRPQGLTYHVVLVEHVQRLVEVARQLIDAVFPPLAEAYLE